MLTWGIHAVNDLPDCVISTSCRPDYHHASHLGPVMQPLLPRYLNLPLWPTRARLILLKEAAALIVSLF